MRWLIKWLLIIIPIISYASRTITVNAKQIFIHLFTLLLLLLLLLMLSLRLLSLLLLLHFQLLTLSFLLKFIIYFNEVLFLLTLNSKFFLHCLNILTTYTHILWSWIRLLLLLLLLLLLELWRCIRLLWSLWVSLRIFLLSWSNWRIRSLFFCNNFHFKCEIVIDFLSWIYEVCQSLLWLFNW